MEASVSAAIGQLLARGGCDVIVNNTASRDQAEFLAQDAQTCPLRVTGTLA
jgi:hypothetical protein